MHISREVMYIHEKLCTFMRSYVDSWEVMYIHEKLCTFHEKLCTFMRSYVHSSGLQIRERIEKQFSLFLIQNICCGCSKETVLLNTQKHV